MFYLSQFSKEHYSLNPKVIWKYCKTFKYFNLYWHQYISLFISEFKYRLIRKYKLRAYRKMLDSMIRKI